MLTLGIKITKIIKEASYYILGKNWSITETGISGVLWVDENKLLQWHAINHLLEVKIHFVLDGILFCQNAKNIGHLP